MSERRELYRSSNGDFWFLSRDATGQAVVVHQANVPSGGRKTEIEIGAFLRSGGGGPEHQELLRLIGTLMEGSSSTRQTRCTTIPTMRYRDAKAAIGFLCEVFGFERHAVYEGQDGRIDHAELRLGNGMVMLGSLVDNEYGRNIAQPDEVGGRETQSPYLVVADADAVHARAKVAGFDMVLDIADQDHGGRAFTCRDPQGHLWNVGTYDPWVHGS